MKMTKPRGQKTINVAMALALVAMLAAAFLSQPALASPDTVTYYFNGHYATECWANDPAYMTDGDTGTYAYTNSGEVQLNNSNTCPGTDLGTISNVELRAHGYGDGGDYVYLRPVFTGGPGDDHSWTPGTAASWSLYYDITNDPNAPSSWTWTDVQNLDVDVEYAKQGKANNLYIAKVEIRVTYTPPAPPTVNSVTLTDTSMTPQMEYTVTVNVSDANGKADLDTLVLKVYYDGDGGTPTDVEAEAQTANTQSCAIITWTQSTDSFAIQPSASTSWSLGSCLSPGSLPGDFTFVFTPGKVATETPVGAVWQLWAKATDDTSQTDTNYDSTPPTMNWYGEITVNTSNVNWGTVDLGSDFDANSQTGISVTYICNGGYNQQVKADSPWTNGGGASVTLGGESPGAGEFSLKADDTATLGSAVLVSTSYVTIDSGSQTDESGNTESANTLWLRLGSSGIPAVTYSGTIYYCIAQ